jgi:hypothetical protein
VPVEVRRLHHIPLLDDPYSENNMALLFPFGWWIVFEIGWSRRGEKGDLGDGDLDLE